MAAGFARRREGRGRGQVPDRGRQAVLPSRRHLRAVRAAARRQRVPRLRRSSIATSRGWRRAASTPFAPTPRRRPGCSTSRYDYGLRVFIGVPWEQHVTFLDSKAQRRSIVKRVEQAVAACAAPSGGARLRGRQRDPGADRSLARPPAASSGSSHCLYEEAKSADPRPSSPTSTSRPPSTSSSPFSTSSRLERLPRDAADPQPLSGATAEPRRREAAGPRRARPRQPAQRRAQAGRRARLADPHRGRGRLRRASSSSPGPTSGTAPARRSSTGASV